MLDFRRGQHLPNRQPEAAVVVVEDATVEVGFNNTPQRTSHMRRGPMSGKREQTRTKGRQARSDEPWSVVLRCVDE